MMPWTDIFLSNPAGLWGLIGIPIVLAIHFLQTKARHVLVSTLFLVEELDKESLGGRRIERLRNSVPLWLQLLCVLLLTWILVQPRWVRKEGVQSVVVLLDASVSMEAFRKDLVTRLGPSLVHLTGAANRTEWTVMDTNAAGTPLYNGTELTEAMLSLDRWRARLTSHDYQRAFGLARALSGEKGAVVFVTDQPIITPEGITLLAIGEPIENCGFAGVNITSEKWEASLKNYGKSPAIRTWRLLAGGGVKLRSQRVTLPPGQTTTVEGEFPSNSLRLEIEPDAFHLDDILPMVRPVEKVLKVQVDESVKLYNEIMKIEADLEPVEPGQPADLLLALYDPLAPASYNTNAIVSVKEPSTDGKQQQGQIFAESDPLTEDLSWQGLTVRDALQAPSKPGDRILLWQGDRPLIYVRFTPDARYRQLIINFDIDQSNARRVPAFVVLIHRFLRQVRQSTPGFEVVNFEANQRIPLAFAEPGDELSLEMDVIADPSRSGVGKISPAQARSIRAPPAPSVLQVLQGKRALLQGATHFADVREADFANAGSADGVRQLAGRMIERRAETDFLTPIWALLLVSALLVNYAWLGRKR